MKSIPLSSLEALACALLLVLGAGCAPERRIATVDDELAHRTGIEPAERRQVLRYHGGLMQTETPEARSGELFGVIGVTAAGFLGLVTSRNAVDEWSTLPRPFDIAPVRREATSFSAGTSLRSRPAAYHLGACGGTRVETRADDDGVTAIEVSGAATTSLRPFGSGFRGPASAACGFDGDGALIVVGAAGAGALPAVSWFRVEPGGTFSLLRRQIVYGDSFRGGVEVALGRLDGDDELDLAVAPRSAGEMAVKIYHSSDGYAESTSRRLPVFRGTASGPGLRLTIGRFTDLPTPVLAVALGPGVQPAVDVFSPRLHGRTYDLVSVFAGRRPLLFGEEFRGGVANLSTVPDCVFGREMLLACPGHGGREVCTLFQAGY